MKFKVLKDIIIMDKLVTKSGDTIFCDDNGECTLMNDGHPSIKINIDFIKSNIEEIKIDSNIRELDVNSLDEIKLYRLQLDVKTSMRRAKEIEQYLRQTLENMI